MMKHKVLERRCNETRENRGAEAKTHRPLISDEAGNGMRPIPPSWMMPGGFGAVVCLEGHLTNPPAEDVAGMFRDAEVANAEAAWVN